MRIGCAILAAGSGSRYSEREHKLLASVRGKPLLAHAIDAACSSPATSCTLVLGARADEIAACVETLRCAAIVNERWAEGLSSSIRCAIRAHRDDDGCILMLGDQPNVTAVDLSRMIETHATRRGSVVALRRLQLWGAPILFHARDYPALLALEGDAGAKRYAASQERRLAFVTASHDDAFADVDVKRDIARVT